MASRDIDIPREKILKAASNLFIENGFAHVSTSEIARRAEASKETLYKRFPSKAELFFAVMEYCCLEVDVPNFTEFNPHAPIEEKLFVAGQGALHRLFSKRAFRVFQAAIASATTFPEIPKTFWALAPKNVFDYVVACLNEYEKTKKRKLGADRAARIFINEIFGPFLFTAVLTITEPPTPKEADAWLEIYVPLFFKRFESGYYTKSSGF